MSDARNFPLAQGDNAEQERPIARIEKLGGKVELDEQRPGKPVIRVDLRRTKVTDADLEILKALTRVRSPRRDAARNGPSAGHFEGDSTKSLLTALMAS